MSNFLFIQNKCKLNFKIFYGQAINKTNAITWKLLMLILFFVIFLLFNLKSQVKDKITNETNIRVRYAETDTMGILHHAVYPIYFEEGRTELMRSYGTTYDAMEKSGVILPVYNVNINYLQPAYYDDLLSLKTTMAEIRGVRLRFSYELFNEKKILLATGDVTLIFTDDKSFKPVRPPKWFIEMFSNQE